MDLRFYHFVPDYFRKSVKLTNDKKGEETAEVPKKKVKDTGSRKSSLDVLDRRGSQSKQSSIISQKAVSPDTLTASSKTPAKTSKDKSNGQQKK